MKKTSIKLNYFYNMIYQGLIMILPLFTAPYVARVIGANGVGIYSYSFSIAQYFVYFAMLGIGVYGNRSIARVQDDEMKRSELFSEIYTLQFILCILVFSFYVFYCFFSAVENAQIAWLQLFFVSSAFLDVSWFFFGMEDFKTTVTRQIFIKIFTCVMVFLVVKNKSDLWKYTLILSVGTLLGQAYLFYSIKKYIKFFRFKFKEAFVHFKPVLILFIPIIATSIYRVMDKVMIGSLSNMNQVGYYENSDKLIATALGVIGALGSVMLPRMSNLVATGKHDLEQKYILKSMEITMCVGCAIAFGIAAVSKEFIPLFYGDGFQECIIITVELAISAIFIAWANVVRMQHVIPHGKDNIYVYSVISGAIINVFINYLLIPKYGAKGAAIGTIFAEAMVMFLQTYMSRKDLDIKNFIKVSIPFFIFGLIMFVIVRWISSCFLNRNLALFVEIVSGALIYISLCGFYFIKTKNKIILNLLKKGLD